MLSPVKVQVIVQTEPLLVVVCLALVSFLAYVLLLRKLSADRHDLIRGLFRNLLAHLGILLFLFAAFRLIGGVAHRYIGLITILWGSIVFVKLSRICAFEYLFFVSKKAGVPVLLVNILSLGISIALASWIATEVFGVRLVPVLATSALISVILGLAIQDTLGNLFAGVALQFDKPYEIGHWVEIQSGGQKFVGQVREITWRSTVLIGFAEEVITIPNRMIAQSQVSAWGSNGRPFWHGLSYRVPFGQPVEEVRRILLGAIKGVSGILKTPGPGVFLTEVGESSLNFRVSFCLDNYGMQFRINDRVNSAVMEALLQNRIPVATPAMRVELQEGTGSQNEARDDMAAPVDG